MTSDIRAVIFDFDGVFVDSHICIYRAYNYMKKKLGLKNFDTFEDFKRLYSVNFTNNYEQMGIKPHEQELANSYVQEYLEQNYAAEAEGFAGMIKVANSLERKTAIASSGMSCIIREKCRQVGLREMFIAGRDNSIVIKPNPKPLIMCMENLKVSPEQCAYVGDTTIDIEAGRNANTAVVIAVSWGFDSIEKLAKSKPDAILLAPHELRLFI